MKCYLCGNTERFKKVGHTKEDKEIKVYKCLDCSLVFLNNKLSSKFYEDDGMSTKGDTMEETDNERRYKTLYTSFIRYKKYPIKILDFGCGNGSFLYKINRNFNDTLESMNSGIRRKKHLIKKHEIIELSALEINNAYRPYLMGNFNYHNCIESLPGDYFDVITMYHVLEHLQDPIKILNLLHRKLKKGGNLIIEIPNDVDNILNKLSKEYNKRVYTKIHLYYFNKLSISSLINKTDFKTGDYYINFIQRYPFSNHVGWIMDGKPNGHIRYPGYDTEELNKVYPNALSRIWKTDTMEIILEK